MTVTTSVKTQRLSPRGGARRLVSSFTRPANATAYTAGDVISASTDAEVLGFTAAGNGGVITGVSVQVAQTVTTALRLIVFDEEPTNLADNAALALSPTDLDLIVGVYDFTDANKINVGTNRELYVPSVTQFQHAYTSDGGKLYALLVTPTGFTPGSGAYFVVNLHIEDNG